jgi:transposase
MPAKRMYRRVSVKKVSLEGLKDIAFAKGGAGTCVGLDIGKSEIVAVVRWPDGAFECPMSVNNPSEIADLVAVLVMLRECCSSLTIGLESTGTYGEPVRAAMTAASLDVHRISGKASSDYKEIFDGVPSQHDGKDAAIIAELTCFGKGTPWPFQPRSENDQRIKHQVRRMDVFHEHVTEWTGRLEAVLAEHWPELSGLLSLNSVTLVKIMIHYGSPARLAADPTAREKLAQWGRSVLKPQKIEQIVESARTTKGTPLDGSEMAWLQEIAMELQEAITKVNACKKELESIANTDDSMREYVSVVGAVTLCVIWATVGNPSNYDSSGAFLKALGLNLKELSSGQRQGQLAITKRGSGLARKYLFFWSLRAVQTDALKRWYADFQKVGRGSSGTSEHRKMKGLVALMRKLSRSLWYSHKRHEAFDYAKVFPGRPMEERKRRRRRPQVTGK